MSVEIRSFRGSLRGELRGVVDVLAIRRDMREPAGKLLKREDLFDVIQIQNKGGCAGAPTTDDCAQKVVLFSWRRGASSQSFELRKGDDGVPTNSHNLFG